MSEDLMDALEKQNALWAELEKLVMAGVMVSPELIQVNTEPEEVLADISEKYCSSTAYAVGVSGEHPFSLNPGKQIFISETRRMVPFTWFTSDEQDKAAAMFDILSSALEDLQYLANISAKYSDSVSQPE